MAHNVVTISWHSVSNKSRNLISGGCIAASIWTAWHAHSPTLAIVSVLFAFAAIGAQVDQSVTIDQAAGHVARTISLWGWRFWKSQWSITSFSGVGTYRLPSGTPQTPRDLVHVGLRRSSGSILAIRYFEAGRGRPCPAADAFADELQRFIGERAVA